MKALLLPLGCSVLVVAAGLILYDRYVIRPALRVGIVDLGEVYRWKEAQFSAALTRNTSEAERARTMASVRQFTQRLPTALDELPADCRCTVMLKTSVAGPVPNSVDLTDALKRKLGMAP